MRDTIESYLPIEVTFYRAFDRDKYLTGDSQAIGTARARIENNRNVITGNDGPDLAINVIKVFFFNDLKIKSGDYVSFPDEDKRREIVDLDVQIISEEDDDKYAMATV